MKRYRIGRLDGCDVWRVERLTVARWPFRFWIAPRWLPVSEHRSQIDAVVTVEGFERREREAAARREKSWHYIGVA